MSEGGTSFLFAEAVPIETAPPDVAQPSALERATAALRRLGFAVDRAGRARLTIPGSREDFERVFGVTLQPAVDGQHGIDRDGLHIVGHTLPLDELEPDLRQSLSQVTLCRTPGAAAPNTSLRSAG